MSDDVRVILRKFLSREDLTEDEKVMLEDTIARNTKTVKILNWAVGIIAAGALTAIGVNFID